VPLPGKDVFFMKGGDDVVSGLGGDDTACMGTGDDTFIGGPGDDTFVAEAVADGRDDFFGDDGRNQSGAGDLATYAARTTAVTVSVDGSHNDGNPARATTSREPTWTPSEEVQEPTCSASTPRASARCSEAPAMTR
jgi:Ca2+-binding RTX toxin-like protein